MYFQQDEYSSKSSRRFPDIGVPRLPAAANYVIYTDPLVVLFSVGPARPEWIRYPDNLTRRHKHPAPMFNANDPNRYYAAQYCRTGTDSADLTLLPTLGSNAEDWEYPHEELYLTTRTGACFFRWLHNQLSVHGAHVGHCLHAHANMGVDPPVLYEKPSTYSFLAPSDLSSPLTPTATAMTQASPWSPSDSRPQSGISFIKMETTDRSKAPAPMKPSTKAKIKWWRVVMLNLRVCTLLGGAGLLFCVVTLKLPGGPLDWMVRIAPGVVALHSLFAIYHLARPAKNRAPASSSSYMMFAAVVDTMLVPFLAFTAYMANLQTSTPVKDPERWKTLFPQQFQTDTIIYASWLISIATGGAEVCAFCICVYLALLFRRIARLPPDMNPLEDNLTSRHKRNKSSISTLVPDPTNGSTSSDQPLIEKWKFSENGSVDSFNSGLQRRTGPPPHSQNSSLEFRSVPYTPGSPVHGEMRRSPARAIGPGAGHPRGSPGRRRGPPSPQRFYAPPSEGAWLMEQPANPLSRMAPPELQHLRHHHHPGARGMTTETSLALTPGHRGSGMAQRSPKPLGMNPSTPQGTPGAPASAGTAGAEYARNPYRSPTREGRQALRDLVNSQSGGSDSPMTWEEVNLRPGAARRAEEVDLSPQGASHTGNNHGKGRFYGSLHGMISGSRDGKRVTSSGVEAGLGAGSEWGGVLKRREVSGKVAEEGRSVMVH